MTLPMEVNLPWIYEVIQKSTDALLLVAVIVCAFVILEALDGLFYDPGSDDDDPDAYS